MSQITLSLRAKADDDTFEEAAAEVVYNDKLVKFREIDALIRCDILEVWVKEVCCLYFEAMVEFNSQCFEAAHGKKISFRDVLRIADEIDDDWRDRFQWDEEGLLLNVGGGLGCDVHEEYFDSEEYAEKVKAWKEAEKNKVVVLHPCAPAPNQAHSTTQG